jgi:hypothetical protein
MSHSEVLSYHTEHIFEESESEVDEEKMEREENEVDEE